MFAIFVIIASTSPARVNDLSWLSGHWLECTARRETSETWTDARGGVMLGVSRSVSRNRTDWELARIDTTADGVTLFANPKGQAPTTFRAVSMTAERVVFENASHDFPQRVIYTRQGDRLTGRIEGSIGGKPRSLEWHYRAATLNAACPVLAQ